MDVDADDCTPPGVWQQGTERPIMFPKTCDRAPPQLEPQPQHLCPSLWNALCFFALCSCAVQRPPLFAVGGVGRSDDSVNGGVC